MKHNNGRLLNLTNVLYTPDLSRSLVSLNRLFNKKSSITKEKNEFVINLDNVLSLSGSVNNNLWELSPLFEMNNSVALCFSSSLSVDWHARLGHPSSAYLKKLIPLAKCVDNCETCKMCKSTKLPFKGKFSPALENLEAIHLDLVGPFQTRSVSGCRYFLTIVDQFSGFKTVKLLKHKSETLTMLEEFVSWAENQTGKKIKQIISDNGGEFTSIFFQEFCRERGIAQHFAPAYTPQNNGMAERANRAILDKA
jgi:hypothetical protein